MNVQVFTSGDIKVNNYLISHEKSKRAILVDASEGIEQILSVILRNGLSLEALFLTHSHFDHISGLRALLEAYPDLPLYMHSSERVFLADAKENLSIYIDAPFTVDLTKEPIYVREGDTLSLLGTEWQIWHIPGHSPGSLALLNEEEGIGFTGDVIFPRGGVGRYDLPHSNEAQVRASAKRLCTLRDDYRLYTGHSSPLTVSRERPFH